MIGSTSFKKSQLLLCLITFFHKHILCRPKSELFGLHISFILSLHIYPHFSISRKCLSGTVAPTDALRPDQRRSSNAAAIKPMNQSHSSISYWSEIHCQASFFTRVPSKTSVPNTLTRSPHPGQLQALCVPDSYSTYPIQANLITVNS